MQIKTSRRVLLLGLVLLSTLVWAREHSTVHRVQRHKNQYAKGRDLVAEGTGGPYARHLQMDNLPLPEGAFNTPEWKESIKIYSAMRDPLSGEVALFFDAEDWLHPHLNLYFISGPLPGDVCESAETEVAGDCELRDMGMKMARRSSGYSLICKDPGQEFGSVALRTSKEEWISSSCMYAAYSIEQISIEKKGVVGACLSPMYSKPRIPFEQWISDHLGVGISGVLVYYTDFKLPASALHINAIRYAYDENPFTPIPHPLVRYLKYVPPWGRYYLGQTTVMNECIYRLRNQYDFLSVADADEFLTVTSPEQTLEQLLQTLLPSNAHSLLLEAVMYPADCQSEATDSVFPKAVTSPRQGAHFLDKGYEPFRGPKSIIRPGLVRVLDVHYAQQMAREDTYMAQTDRRQLYYKHINGPVGDCGEDSKQYLIDDRDPEAFLHSYLHHGHAYTANADAAAA